MTAADSIVRQEPFPRAGREPGLRAQPAASEATREEGSPDRRTAVMEAGALFVTS